MRSYVNEKHLEGKGYRLSTDKNAIDIKAVHGYLSKDAYWARGIPEEKLAKAICNSMCFTILQQDCLAAFARVITDQATFAYICDVFVLPDHRRQGLGKWLIQSITSHPELSGLRRWSLATADAQGLYRQFGFMPIAHPERWMEIFKSYSSPDGGRQ